MSVDTLGRRSLLRPASTGKRVTLQDSDWHWLQWLHGHGPLTSSFLLAAAKEYGKSEKRAKERLGHLFHEKNTAHGGPYLTRPPQQFSTVDSRYNQLVYGLAPAGERALKERGVWQERNSSGGGPWLHRFMVSSITASIQLAAEARSDLRYIPQAEILDRAGTGLSYPVAIRIPKGRLITTTLKPDALFGLEYLSKQGSRYRFFVVEADRATEPLNSKNYNRKSALRSLLQYNAYIADGAYKSHLKLTSPLLVLNVFSDERRAVQTAKLIEKQCPDDVPYMLFQTWGAFAQPFRPPQPNPDILCRHWLRSGLNPIHID